MPAFVVSELGRVSVVIPTLTRVITRRHAVSDGASGLALVVLPEDQGLALGLRAAHQGRFWCSTEGGGCGQHLILAAGSKQVPHFRHHAGEAYRCDLADKPEEEERSLLHLLLQLVLQQWLADQGFDSRLEKTLPDGSRADLHVEIDSVGHTLEVQLSPLGLEHWRTRNRRYSRQVATVDWLFGDLISQDLLREQIHTQGYAFRIARNKEADPAAPPSADNILIGTANHNDIGYALLSACTLTPDGLVTPDLDVARRIHARWLAEQQTPLPAAEEEEEEEEEEKAMTRISGWGFNGERKPPLADTTARRATDDQDEETRRRRRARTRGVSAPAKTGRGAGRNPLASFDWIQSFDTWESPTGLCDDVPEDLHHPVRLMAFIVTRLEAAGAQSTLSFPDVDDDGAIQAALVRAGLVELYDTDRGFIRWTRPIPSSADEASNEAVD